MSLVIEQTGSEALGAWTDGTATAASAAPGGIILSGADDLHLRSLTLTWVNGTTTTGPLTISMVQSQTPDLFSNSNLPSSLTTFQVASAASTTYTSGESDSIALDFESRASADPLDRTNYWTTPTSLLRADDANGRMALVVGFTSGTALSMGSLAFTADTLPDFTGLHAAPSNFHRSRAIACPRCGNWTYEEFLTRDGYTRTLVCSECYDPPDPTERTRHRRSREHRPR